MSTTFLTKKLSVVLFFTIVQLSLNATVYPINVTFSGAQEAPANGSAGTGTFVGTYNDVTDSLIFTITFSGLSANVTAAHFHAAPPGISAGVLIGPSGFPTGVMSGSFTDTLVLTAGQEDTLKKGLMYFNIHTSALPGGEIRAQIFLQDPTFVLPDISCPADITSNNDPGLCSASVAFAATVNTGTPAATLYYRIGNTAITSPHVFPVGTTIVIATALNSVGYDSCSLKVTVVDAEPPVVTCPANITRSNDPGDCGAIVNYPPATATDNCPGLTIAYSHTSGSFFPVGTTVVTVTATDAAGNTSTCTFNITVNDTEPPVINDLAAIPPILWPPNHKMKIVTVNYTSTDNCPGPITCQITITSDEPENGTGDGDVSPDWNVLTDHIVKLRAERAGNGDGRVYTITMSCTDQYGNRGTDTTTVIVPHDMSLSLMRRLLFLYRNHGNGNNGRVINGIATETDNKNLIVMNEEDPDNLTLIRVYPNPSSSYFTLNIETLNNRDKISVRMIDIAGRVVEVKNNLSGSQLLRIGNNLKAGLYFAEIRQGTLVQLVKLLKTH